jgi:hypothetical protein
MFLTQSITGDLVEVLDTASLANPYEHEIKVQFQHGEDLNDPELIDKHQLCFPSGEALPECWLNAHYRHAKVFSRFTGAGRF